MGNEVIRERTCHCPAKVNLALSVGPPRDDGLHPIASWMVALAFGDRLTVRRIDGDSDSDGDGNGDHRGDGSVWRIAFADDAPQRQVVDWPLDRDLAYRAHALLEAHVGRRLPIEVELRKRVPAGAGLGGGSSDAAGVLVTCNQLFGLGLPLHTLMELARQLGADVSFLVAAMLGLPSAIVTGVGEAIEPATREQPIDLALVLPPFGCPTGAVYQAFDAQRADAVLHEAAVRTLAGGDTLAADGPFNDLASPAMHVQPLLGEAVAQLTDALAMPVHVTGSGSAMFIVARSPDHAHALADAAAETTGYATVATQTVGGVMHNS